MKKCLLLLLLLSVLTLTLEAQVQYGGQTNVTKYGGVSTTLGQKIMSASQPFTIASDQSVIPVSVNATGFTYSASGINTSTAQLAAGATFTGVLESIPNQPAYSLLVYSDQPATITINEYIDGTTNYLVYSKTYIYSANGQFQVSNVANGNYFQVIVQNTGGSTTTKLNINTAYGVIGAATVLNNEPTALNEVSGSILQLGNNTMAASLPVTIASNQSAIPVTGTISSSTNTDKSFSGNLTALNSTLAATTNGSNTSIFEIGGTWSGTITFQGSNNNFVTSQAITSIYLGGMITNSSTTTTNGFFSVLSQGFAQVQAIMTSYVSGTATVLINVSSGQRIVVPLQGNPNNLQVLATQGAPGATAWKVDGSSVTQPVSIAASVPITNAGLPTALGQNAAAASMPVTLSNENVQDLYITGQAAQTALVNNIIPAIAGANGTDLTGYRSASIQILCSSGIGAGQLIFEGTNDSPSSTNFQSVPVYNQLILTGTPITTAISVASSTAIVYTFPVNFRYLRVRISTAIAGGGTVQAVSKFSQTSWTPPVTQIAQSTSGNLNVTVGSGTLASVTYVSTVSSVNAVGTITPGTAATNLGKGRNSAIGATDVGVEMLSLRNDALTVFGTTGNYNTPIADKYGSLIVKQQYLQKTTYSTAFTVVPAAAATDIFQLSGSATKTVMVQKITISGTQTTGGIVTFIISKRSSANIGGTATAAVLVPHDAADAASSTVGSVYTANPGSGSIVGSVKIVSVPISATTGINNEIIELNFGERGKPIVLTGTAQCLAINLNGATITGGSLNISIEYTEE